MPPADFGDRGQAKVNQGKFRETKAIYMNQGVGEAKANVSEPRQTEVNQGKLR